MGQKSGSTAIVGESTLTTLLFFIIAISILVVVHEYGHFWVARKFGVKVLRFSVGFGKPLIKLHDKQGTEYSVAPIPLGGYVKMLDSREAPVPEHLQEQEFNGKSPWARIAIAVAGPVANFIFAILVFWALFSMGTTQLVPMVADTREGSISALAGMRSGDEILAIEGKETHSWQDIQFQLLNYIGETRDIDIQVMGADDVERQLTIKVKDWLSDLDSPDPIDDLGVRIDSGVSLTIGGVASDSAAADAGLQEGDTLVSVNGEIIRSWEQWVEIAQASANVELLVEFERDSNLQTILLTPKEVTLDSGEQIGQVGVLGYRPESMLRKYTPGIGEAFVMGVKRTGELTIFTLESLWKTITGDLSLKSLSGPITIAKVAGDSASVGLISFVTFLALLSVSLGVLNLLPIPMLDGGHIVFYLIEAVIGKPLPESVQIMAIKIGMLALFALMSIAFYNDISRL